jgi:hypothetical protein
MVRLIMGELGMGEWVIRWSVLGRNRRGFRRGHLVGVEYKEIYP